MNRLSRYKDIVFYRTLAGLKSEARKSFLGYFWFVLEPLLSTGVLYLAMSHVTGQRGPAAVFSILVGVVIWQWFESTVMLSATSITAKFHVHLQVPLPKWVFPMVDVGANTIRFAFAFSLLLVACCLLVAVPGATVAWLPILLALQFALIAGASVIVALGVTLLADLRILTQSLLRMLFFVSGVFFSADRLPEHVLPWFHANPMAVLIEAHRAVLLNGRAPDVFLLTRVGLIAALLLALGAVIHAYYDKRLLKLTNV